jgi:hypothetical protein
MMTTMAALLGGVPLMLGAGTGAEIRQPLGYAIVGGLIVSQALTLYTTPIVFLYLDRLNAWFIEAIIRAVLVALEQWVAKGTPPPSQYSRLDNGSLVPLHRVKFPNIPGVTGPSASSTHALPTIEGRDTTPMTCREPLR